MAVYAILSMALWVMALWGRGPDYLPVNSPYWHAHEMLIGFAMAAVAGFTLTAVATWTGRRPVSGIALASLVLAWVAGRVVVAMGGVLPAVWVAVVDMVFPLLLMALLAREVLLAQSARNYPIVVIVALFALFNAIYHAGETGLIDMRFDSGRVVLYLLVHLLLLLITVIAGRIVPNFTTNWLRARGAERLPRQGGAVDRLVIPFTAATGLCVAFAPNSGVTVAMACGAALTHTWRLSRWCGFATVREPLLFVLHAAYVWFPLGYLLTAASAAGWSFSTTAALHAHTVGLISFTVLAVSSRVALAHTGRPLHAPRLMVLAYLLMLAASIIRVLSPYGASYLQLVSWSAVAWILSFVLFLWVYGPVLVGPGLDKSTKTM